MIAHLHVHSHYSFFDSTLAPEEIPRVAVERGFTVVALTDTNSLAGAVAFFKACREHHVQPILGVEIDDPQTGDRAVVLARDWTGWGELCRLVTERHLRGEPEPAVVQDLSGAWVKGGTAEDNRPRREPGAQREPGLAGRAFPDRDTPWTIESRQETETSLPQARGRNPFEEGEFELSAALARLSSAHVVILTDSPSLLERLALLHRDTAAPTGVPSVNGGQRDAVAAPLYAELILPPPPERRHRARTTYELARRLGLPIVATADVHTADPEDGDLHRLLHAIACGSTVGRLEWDTAPASGNETCLSVCESQISLAPVSPQPPTAQPFSIFHLPFSISPPSSTPGWFLDRCDLRASWKGLRAEIERSIRAIVESCRFELPLGEWKLPRPHLPPDETPFSRLWKIAFAGLERRCPTLTREVIERLRHEIEIIDRLGFSNYFLVVNEIVDEARQRGLYVLGRGSAANSLVSHALGFTGVDPLRHHLYFERFLNPERGSPPDIDLDFSWKDRDAIVDWVFDRFGRDHVALISTTVRLQGRQAIREVAKAMGLADRQISRITRTIPFWYSRSLDLERLEEQHPECRGLPLREEPWRTILAHAQRLLGFPRHYGIHCGGLVITPEPIWRYVPLVRAAKGFVVTQMDMFPIEDLGLIKIDLLGNRSLGVYKDALHLVRLSPTMDTVTG